MHEHKLQRWRVNDNDESAFAEDDGDWIKWEDVEPLLKAYLELNYKFNEIKRILSNIIVVNTEVDFIRDGMKVIELNPKYKGI
jgi:hypothetical protein